MTFLYGLLTATVAIIVAEIVFDYSLGDLLKDKVLALFGKGKAEVTSIENRVKKVF